MRSLKTTLTRSKAILALILVPLLLLSGCARVVTIPAPTAQPICPDPAEQVKAIATSNIDQAAKPALIASAQQASKETCVVLQKTHFDEYTANLTRAAEAGKNVNSWVNTLLGGLIGGGLIGVNVAALLK